MRLESVTRDTRGYRGLQKVPGGYKGKRGYKELQGVMRGYWGLQEITSGYSGL